MGEMADFYIEQALARGGNHSWPHPETPPPSCSVCGSRAVHWRLFDGNYKLADNQRQHPGNRYAQHTCPTSADGFEDVPDA